MFTQQKKAFQLEKDLIPSIEVISKKLPEIISDEEARLETSGANVDSEPVE